MRKIRYILIAAMLMASPSAYAAQMDTYAELVTPASTDDFIMTWDDSATPYASKLMFTGVTTHALNAAGQWVAVVLTESDPIWTASDAFGISTADIAGWDAKVDTEVDPVWTASDAFGISTADIASWDAADVFTTTPSTVITAGTNLSWSGNTLNATGGGASVITDLTGTAWTVFYADGSGDVTEVALGSDGTYLMSNGAAAVPSFSTPSGSGDVSKVGTPVNNQIGVWTGDGTLEGDADLTFDTTTDALNVGGNISSNGTIYALGETATAGRLVLYEPPATGSDSVWLSAPSVTTNYTLIFPTAQTGTNGFARTYNTDGTSQFEVMGDAVTTDSAAISGIWEVQDDMLFNFGDDADFGIRYDEETDDELEVVSDSSSDTEINIINEGSGDTNLTVNGSISATEYFSDAADGSRVQIYPENTSYSPDTGEESIYNVGGDLQMAEAGALVGSIAVKADIAADSAVTANTAKTSNVTHTGDVTGSTALTIANGAVDVEHVEDALKINTAQWNFNETQLGADETEPVMSFKVPVDVQWDGSALDDHVIVCDDTDDNLQITVGYCDTKYGTYTAYDATLSAGSVDVSGWDAAHTLVAGEYVGAWVNTASTGDATKCVVELTLITD